MKSIIITPYIYRYKLDKQLVEVTTDNKIIVYFYGKRREINNLNVEFFGPYDELGRPKLLTIEDFNIIVKGTKGIISVTGEFKYTEKEDGYTTKFKLLSPQEMLSITGELLFEEIN